MATVEVRVLRPSVYLVEVDGDDVKTIKTEVGQTYEIDEEQALSSEAAGTVELI